MWILPKQLHTSRFVADMKALGLDSEEFSQTCEKSLMWRGKDSLSRTWLQRWKRENWMQHLCLRTLRPSHTESFEDAWTSSLGDSHVSLSQMQECVEGLKTLDTSFPTSQTESGSANLEFAFLKTWQESSQPRLETENQFSNMSSEHWKNWVIEQRQEYSLRRKLAHHIKESESSSLDAPHNWMSPTVMDCANIKAERKKSSGGQCPPLSQQVNGYKRPKIWATPISNDAKGSDYAGRKDNQKALYLGGQVKQEENWPTATTRDWKDTNATVPPSRTNPSKQTLGQRVAHVGLLSQASLNMNGKSQESWPTPRANKVHPEITEENREHLANRRKANLEEDIAGHCGKATGKLNANWVEHLMGLPVGWTQLPTEWIDSDCSATGL